MSRHLKNTALNGKRYATVAQLAEQRTRNAQVGGSNPPSGSSFFKVNGNATKEVIL